MSWEPISQEELLEEINASLAQMTMAQRRLWDVIKIKPEKWVQHPYGDEGGGFWAVAILGNTVVWYNDIEEGFNHSKYSGYGQIDDYWSNQDELQCTVRDLLSEIIDGQACGVRLGAPEKIPKMFASPDS